MTLLTRLASSVAVVVLAVSSLVACSGEEDTPAANPAADTDGDDVAGPEEVMAYAKKLLDETSGVRLSLSTEADPDTDAFLKAARGVIVAEPPAFEGSADGTLQGFSATDIGIVSVDGEFYVDVPIQGWTTFDPAELCAPDPATLLDADSGISQVLTAAESLEEGEPRRTGSGDNDEVVAPYTGTVSGDAVTEILPCAPGEEFDATFTVTGEGYLRSAEITGQFFEGGGELTYTIDISEYDVEQQITAPEGA